MNATQAISQAYEQSTAPRQAPAPNQAQGLYLPAAELQRQLEVQKAKNEELEARLSHLQIQIINLNQAFDSHFFWSKVFSGGLGVIIIFLILFPLPQSKPESQNPPASAVYPTQTR